MSLRLEAARAFARTIWVSRAAQTPAAFKAWQTAQVQHWCATRLPRVPFYAKGPHRLQDLPITDKATVMGDFAAFNTEGITADQARAATQQGGALNGFTVGSSSGTSGNKGYFVISPRESYRWLGTILAKTLADMLWRPQRVAVLLPSQTALYETANHTRRLRLRAFDISGPVDQWHRDLQTFDPSVIVAPPKILRHLAEAGLRLSPQRLFAGSETLDPLDRPAIERHFNQPLRQIYMASEGLLGVTCAHGTLHLAEDSTHFEFEPVSDGLVTPLITCFRRDTQILARYRMNDLLRLRDQPCACGSPLQGVTEVVGRMDDVFRLRCGSGRVLLPPDVIRNTVTGAHPALSDFRVIQTASDQVTLHLPPDLPLPAVHAVQTAVQHLLGDACGLRVLQAPFPFDPTHKLRRIENRSRQGATQ